MSMRAIAYPPAWRIIAAVLIAIAGASLPFLLGLVMFSRTQPILPPMLIRAFTILAVTPAAAAWLIARAFAVTLDLEEHALVLDREGLRIEIPCRAIARISPWLIPLPGSGVWLRLRSGRRFEYGLQPADPGALIEMLEGEGGREDRRAALRHPSVIYAHAKHSAPRWRWHDYMLKFVVFALVPTLPLFRVKQLISYGGTFGQYYLLGLQPFLQSFALHWAALSIYLALYASLWRGLAEIAALLAAWVAPSRAARVRQAVEVGCRVLYYGGVPLLLIRFFLPW